MPAAVQPEKILKDLGKLWVDLGTQDENGVLRACALTFIVVVQETQDAGVIGETIAALMHEHPSRAIVIRVREDGREFWRRAYWRSAGCRSGASSRSVASKSKSPPRLRGSKMCRPSSAG
jgi:hypothetical protein